MSLSRSSWITIGLVALLLAAAAILGFAVYRTLSREEPDRIDDISGSAPPTPEFNCPLDGSPADRATATRRPVLVQVDNAPQARPQSGLSQADIVYEAMAEGNVSRFSAIFACREADVVGPVRSARLINLELVPQYDAILTDSGASNGVNAELAATPDISRITDPAFGTAVFYRTADRFAPHNLMTSTGAIRNAAEGAGVGITANVPSLLFKDDAPAPAVNNIGIPYSSSDNVSYQYDPGTNSWLRFLQGSPHIDVLSGGQIAPKNVIVQYVEVSQSNIVEDVGGNLGLFFSLSGTGKVQVFRDGQVIEGAWRRDARSRPTSYLDAAGQPIPLNRGLTFIQLVPVDFQINFG